MDQKMTWKCSKCSYQLQEEKPPEECPSCHEKCDFIDVTCYIPECGGTGGGGSDDRL